MAVAVGKSWQLADRGDGRGDMLPVVVPTWDVIPTQAFTRGSPQNRDIGQYLNDPSAVVTSTSISDPAKESELAAQGVTYDDPSRELRYDGTGSGTVVVSDVVMAAEYGQDSAEEDWQARINDTGVVWYHDFRNDAEVDQFRWRNGVGNDPNDNAVPGTVIRDTGDGVTGGGCLAIIRNAGTQDSSEWWRPFSALNGAGNGRGVDDPGANGTIAPKPYDSSDNAQNFEWIGGYYGNIAYHAADPTYFDGEEFYLQMRVKHDLNRINGTGGGKLVFVTTTRASATDQEIVTVANDSGEVGNLIHSMYFGLSEGDRFIGSGQVGSPSWPSPFDQAGSELGDGGVTQWCRASQPQFCWFWSGNWDTVLYHVEPGLDGQSNSRIRVYVANEGVTSYTRIWDRTYEANFDPNDIYLKNGWNAMIASTFPGGNSGMDSPITFTHRYDQIIFSKNFIPVPQV